MNDSNAPTHMSTRERPRRWADRADPWAADTEVEVRPYIWVEESHEDASWWARLEVAPLEGSLDQEEEEQRPDDVPGDPAYDARVLPADLRSDPRDPSHHHLFGDPPDHLPDHPFDEVDDLPDHRLGDPLDELTDPFREVDQLLLAILTAPLQALQTICTCCSVSEQRTRALLDVLGSLASHLAEMVQRRLFDVDANNAVATAVARLPPLYRAQLQEWRRA